MTHAPPDPLVLPDPHDLRAPLRLLVAYDGSEFRGFALNPGVPTVAGALKSALEQVLHQEVSLICAGRTDAGVHAWGQVVSVHLTEEVAKEKSGKTGELNLEEFRNSLNGICPPSISVREVSWAEPDFDARNAAKSRLYYYHISNRPDLNPLTRGYSWHIAHPLDLKAMKKPVRHLLGEKDFSAFCRKPSSPQGKPKSLSRNVLRAGWEKPDKADPNFLRFYIEADAFCQQMVRSIVGTLVAMGKPASTKPDPTKPASTKQSKGHLDPNSMAEIINSKDRSQSAKPAPPHGLTLHQVHY